MIQLNRLLAVPVVGIGLLFASNYQSARCESAANQEVQKSIRLLFLGDKGHHQPAARFRQLQPALAQRGIELKYTENAGDLNSETLAAFDGLVVYANIEQITPQQETALLEYVASGKGFVPIHCASYCFLNSPKYVELVGAQFQRHGTGVVRTTVAEPSHPVMRGFRGFESWDETYVHTRHNAKDRIVLEHRAEGNGLEPWTWVRTHGSGRVFYTAWGHDDRTWGNPGFHNLIERGIRWSTGRDPSVVPAFADRPEMTPRRQDVQPFEYAEANVPYYPPGRQWGTTQGGKRMMQLPLEASESMKHIVTPVGFEVKLFVAEPDLGGKPIAMNWDERGRLWVCETFDYPNEMQPRGKGRDRIRICQDSDGDGRADTFHVFAEGLSIPTTLTYYRGGAIVQDGPETVYLKDLDGDDRADLRKVLITGWAMNDTHGGVSNFQYGLDNWFYAMQGYNQSQPVLTDGRKTTAFRQGFFRFKVSGDGDAVAVTELEFLRSTNNNTWGLGISEDGLIFGSTANGNPSEFMAIPNRYYEAVRGWSSSVLTGIADSNRFEPVTENVRQVDHHGGFTAAAGHALYTARNYPQEYWNRAAFVTEPTGHLIATFILRPDGAGFRSRNSWNLFASHDEWTSPIMAEVGPDGNVWVIDWYNYIVQHNPTPPGFRTGRGNAYENELRDKKHGRIYRVVYTGSPDSNSGNGALRRLGQPGASLANASTDELVAALQSDNFFWRRHAQRLLVERRATDAMARLAAMARNDSVDPVGLNTSVIHALHALHGLGAFDERSTNNDALQAAITAVQKHKSPAVVRNALQVLPRTDAVLKRLLDAGPAHIDGPGQLALLLWIAELPPADIGRELAAALALCADSSSADRWLVDSSGARPATGFIAEAKVSGTDRWLIDAATAAAARHDSSVLRAVMESVRTRQPNNPPVYGPAFTNKAGHERLRIIAEHYARGAPVQSVGTLIESLASAMPEDAESIVAGFAKGWPKDKPAVLSQRADSSMATLLSRLSPAGRGALTTLASRWGSTALEKHVSGIAREFLAAAADETKPEADRVSAATQLVELKRSDSNAAVELLKAITPRSSPEFAKGLIEAVSHSEAPAVGQALVESINTVTPAVRASVMRALLSRGDWTPALLDALDAGAVQLTDLSLDQKQALASYPDKAIAERAKELLARGGGLPNSDRQKVFDELLPLTNRAGNVAVGKEVFKKNCAKCHIHSGEGTRIGPDLTGMAVHPKSHLLTDIVDPSRSVEGNFRVYTLALKDGRVMSGLLASESKTALELFDAEGKKHAVQRDDIDEMISSTKSLMPDGFEKQITSDEIVDLLEFLCARGKYLPLDLRKVATTVSTRGMFYESGNDTERLVFADWSPKSFNDVPFQLVDPQGDRVPNAVLFYGPQGKLPPTMPKSIALPCNSPAKAIHLLSGVSGWGFPLGQKGSVTLIVRLHYADGSSEEHELQNGVHFADYIRVVDVPESKLAFRLRGRQLRYLAVRPARPDTIREIEFEKGPDDTAPVIMAITVETGE
jgi:putative membrane-bound dehydrogenase-like protein